MGLNEKEAWDSISALRSKAQIYKYLLFGSLALFIFSFVKLFGDSNTTVFIILLILGMVGLVAFAVMYNMKRTEIAKIIDDTLKPYINDVYSSVFERHELISDNQEKRAEIKRIFDASGLYSEYNKYASGFEEEVTYKGKDYTTFYLDLKERTVDGEGDETEKNLFSGVGIIFECAKNVDEISEEFFDKLDACMNSSSQCDIFIENVEGKVIVTIEGAARFGNTYLVEEKGINDMEALKKAIHDEILYEAKALDVIADEFDLN